MINNNIREAYCSYPVSKLLKEKKFNVSCNFYYYEKYYAEMLNKNRENLGLPERFEESGVGKQLNKHWKGRLINRNQYDTTTSRPTHSVAIEWIRVNFELHIKVDWFETDNNIIDWDYCIQKIGVNIDEKGNSEYLRNYDTKSGFNSPQEAVEAALLYTLQNLIK